MPTVSIKSQKGMGLLEALVAVGLAAIVILGGAYGASRILASQQKTNMHYVVINELRTLMQTATTEDKAKWCDGSTKPEIKLPNETTPTEVTVECAEYKVTLNASNPTLSKSIVTKQPAKFKLNNTLLGGEVIIGEDLQ